MEPITKNDIEATKVYKLWNSRGKLLGRLCFYTWILGRSYLFDRRLSWWGQVNSSWLGNRIASVHGTRKAIEPWIFWLLWAQSLHYVVGQWMPNRNTWLWLWIYRVCLLKLAYSREWLAIIKSLRVNPFDFCCLVSGSECWSSTLMKSTTRQNTRLL